MRIVNLKINSWRNFRGISLEIPEGSKLVCLVGENGAGKSNILELISAAAHYFGISPGIQIARGNPFDEDHDVEIVIKFPEAREILLGEEYCQTIIDNYPTWDGTLRLESSRGTGTRNQTLVYAGGIENPEVARSFAISNLIPQIRQRKDTFYLFLDADRAYPPTKLRREHFAEGLMRAWDSIEWRKNKAFLPTRQLYEEWINFMLSVEGQEATQHFQKLRKAQELCNPAPLFTDHFLSFKNSLRKVLQHLQFEGVDQQHQTILFDTAAGPLNYNQLSGGEREIAFLIGQIERFQLRRGLLLVDEPELHLNSDLIRIWISFLRDTVEDGQTWIATHSLEAVEVAGRISTFVLERSETRRVVDCASSLENRPILNILAGALGSPAFSLTRLRFVFVEGDRGRDERERFHKLCQNAPENRFMEGGGCKEVIGRVRVVSELAAETESQIRVGGILDRDFRTQSQLDALTKDLPVFVLPCHEVENLFLHPTGLTQLQKRMGGTESVEGLLQLASDRFAGGWIFQHAYTQTNDLPEPSRTLKDGFWNSSWAVFSQDIESKVMSLIALQPALNSNDRTRLKTALEIAARIYKRVRLADTLWKECLGKQTLAEISRKLGFRGPEIVEGCVLQMWANDEVQIPAEVESVRDFVSTLQ
ncbi:AAA family ATPase [bacterium]|nr:AAA family ATPase [bacterium]